MLSGGGGQKITLLSRQFKIDNPSPQAPEKVKELTAKNVGIVQVNVFLSHFVASTQLFSLSGAQAIFG